MSQQAGSPPNLMFFWTSVQVTCDVRQLHH